MAAWFQRDIGRGTTHFRSAVGGIFQRLDFSMCLARRLGVSLADNASVLDYDTTHPRIGRCNEKAVPREFERARNAICIVMNFHNA